MSVCKNKRGRGSGRDGLKWRGGGCIKFLEVACGGEDSLQLRISALSPGRVELNDEPVYHPFSTSTTTYNYNLTTALLSW